MKWVVFLIGFFKYAWFFPIFIYCLLFGMIEIFGAFDIIDDDGAFSFLSRYWKISSINKNYHVYITEGN